MDSYNLSYTLGIEQQKRLSDLARRCRRINDEEHANCQRVADAFSEMYSADLLVLDADRDLLDKRHFSLNRSGINL